MAAAVTLNRRLAHDVWINIQFIVFPPALAICKHGSVPRKLVQTSKGHRGPPESTPGYYKCLECSLI